MLLHTRKLLNIYLGSNPSVIKHDLRKQKTNVVYELKQICNTYHNMDALAISLSTGMYRVV